MERNLEWYRARVLECSLADKLTEAEITRLAYMLWHAFQAGQAEEVNRFNRAVKS